MDSENVIALAEKPPSAHRPSLFYWDGGILCVVSHNELLLFWRIVILAETEMRVISAGEFSILGCNHMLLTCIVFWHILTDVRTEFTSYSCIVWPNTDFNSLSTCMDLFSLTLQLLLLKQMDITLIISGIDMLMFLNTFFLKMALKGLIGSIM